MKKLGMLFACALLAACGSKSSDTREPKAEPVAETTALPETESATYAAPEGTTPTPPPEEETTPAASAEAQPTAAPEPAMASMTATAEVKSVKDGTTLGTVTFTQTDTGAISMSGEFTGLKKNGVHALYIHENGDCSNKGKKVGPHLNPTKAKHGPPASSTRHAGDFGNLTADDAGNATFSMETDSVTMQADRPDSILDRSIVIHARKDDKKGNAGAPIACGVIQLQP